MARDPACGAWTLTALDDPSLPISRNPVGPPADTKIAVAVARIPGRGGSGRSTLSFSFTVARNRWSYRRLHPGVAALFLGGAGVGVAATLARRRFRFNVEL
jgi:hypothetical protein